MTNKSTKKALALSIISLVVCVSMLVGTTFAWFTDSVTSTNNIIKSGNLDVELEWSTDMAAWTKVDDNTNVFKTDTLWEPGHTEVVYLRVSNLGSLALKYQLGVNIASEVEGVNVAGEKFKLSDYIYYGVADVTAKYADRAAAVAAVKDDATIISKNFNKNGNLAAKAGTTVASDVVAMVVYMPETVGNEANHNGTAPVINLGINLLATQYTSEADSFDNQYDAGAELPIVALGTVVVDKTNGVQSVDLRNPAGNKVGSVSVPNAALADDAKSVNVSVVETAIDSTVTVTADQDAKTYEVKVEGIKANNTELITVQLDVGMGLTGVKVYHKNVEVTGAVYDPNTGSVRFQTTSFSPYTVVFDAEPVEKDEADLETTVPTAVVNQITPAPKIKWETSYGYAPSDADQQLDAVYSFKAPHTGDTVDDSKYADWYCDYYVMLKSNTLDTLPEGYITLGGNYGTWGWIGFDNPEVDTNVEIPLLGSVTQNPWTYRMVVSFVSEFLCGVGVTDNAGNTLNGSQFIVKLRLTNPEDKTEYYDVNTVIYDFATQTSTFPKTVYSGQELQDAINNGNGNIVLGDDIDLSQGLVIPGL